MTTFVILRGSIKKGRLHGEGEEIELSAEEAATINKKGRIVEPIDVANARVKAVADAKAAVEKAETEAEAKSKAAVEPKKGGGK